MIYKSKYKSDEKFGKKPEDRSLEELFESGYINLDKHPGPTSHVVTEQVKKLLNCKKTGHSGTLDPKVTGVLLIGLGKGTRLMEYMLKSNKEYVCHMFMHKEITKKEILKAFKKFTGVIKQTPPVISAVKRQEREREIYYIELLDYENNGRDVLFRVGCQHGTYIRKLCSDMGEYLEVGAHMKELRRTKAGPIREEDNIISLDKLRNLLELYNEAKNEKEKEIFEKELKKYIRPMEELLKDIKKIYLKDSTINSISHGGDLAIPGIFAFDENIEMGEEVALMSGKGELVAMGTAMLSSKQIEKKNKGFLSKVNKVFIEPDIYPKINSFQKKES